MKFSLILVFLIAGNEVLGLDVIETMFKKIGTYGKQNQYKIGFIHKM